MDDRVLQGLFDKSLTSKQLFGEVEENWDLLPTVVGGISSPKAAIRYGCAKVLMDLSEKYPERLYPNMDLFVSLLDSKYRILVWDALAIIANLTKKDVEKRFDRIFDRYFGLLNDGYMVTVANVVGNSGKIALAKPYLADRIADELLKVEDIKTGPHLTEECKRVIAEHAIQSFDVFFERIKQKERIVRFVELHGDTTRRTLNVAAQKFLHKWCKQVP